MPVRKPQRSKIPVKAVAVVEPSKFEFLPDSGVNRIMAQVAFALAEGVDKDSDIAKKLKISPAAIPRWRRDPAFQRVVQLYRDKLQDRVATIATQAKEERMRRLDKLAGLFESVIEERGDAYKLSKVPGAKSGLLERDRGKFKYDKALMTGYHDTLSQQAREVGGAFEKADGQGAANKTAVIVIPIMAGDANSLPKVIEASVELDTSR